jgi:nucleolar pre-ribosomal-associated protein 1
VRIYGGTVSDADRKILSIFRLFEVQRKVSVTSLLSRWSSSEVASTNPVEAIQSMDPAEMLRTCLVFPPCRQSLDQASPSRIAQDMQYDPVFVMLLFASMLSEGPPSSAVVWVEVFRTNIVSLLIRYLSSKDDSIRDMALCQIVGLWKNLQVCFLAF